MEMFTKEIRRIFGALVRMSLAVFMAAASVQMLLAVMNVQASDEQLLPALPNTQTLIPITASDWSNDCMPQKLLIAGVGLGASELLINPQVLTWPYAENILTMQAQLAGVITNEPLPEAVVLSTNAGEQIAVTEQVTNEIAYYLSSPLLPASIVTSTILFPVDERQTAAPQPPIPQSGLPPKGSGPRGLVLYAQVEKPELWTSVGRLTLASVTSQRDVVDSSQELITFPPLLGETDLIVTAVSIDNNADDRAIIVEAFAGGVVTAVSEMGPSHGDILNITTLTLTAVPTGTRQLSLTIKSPPSPTGDSATLIGFNLNYRCRIDLNNSVDLIIDQVGSSPLVSANTPVSFTVNISNASLLTATNIIVSNALGSDKGPLPNPSWLSCPTPVEPNVCYLGDLSPGETESFNLWLTPTLAGTVTNTAVATSDQPDPTTPNIATATLIVTDYAYISYLPIVIKPGSVAVTLTHSQNPAINNIPYSYFISITNTGDKTIPNLLIEDDFDDKLLIEQVTPPFGCTGTVSSPNDLTVLCVNGLTVNNTITFSVGVRPAVTSPTAVEANVKVSSLEPGQSPSNNTQIAKTQIDLCLGNSPEIGNAYSPLLFGETYCGRVQDQKDAKYFFTFTLTKPGRVVATLRPAQAPVSWIPSNVDYPSLSQLAFTSSDGNVNLAWCCRMRTGTIITEYTYFDGGEKLLMIKSLETFGFTYTLNLDYFPIYNFNTAVLPAQKSNNFSDMRLLGNNSKNNVVHIEWRIARLFIVFLSVAYSLVQRKGRWRE